MKTEIWILGAAGRTGVAVAAQLAQSQLPMVLVGRNAGKLQALAGTLGERARVVTANGMDAIAAELSRGNPGVVINTIAPFGETAPPIIRACKAGVHYIDLSNDLASVLKLLGMNDEAVAAGKSLLTGVGFGVLGTESVVLKLCEGQPPAQHVRVDMIPALDMEAGAIGESLASSIIHGLAHGACEYADGRLVKAAMGDHRLELTLPDGTHVLTASASMGELEAARRASGAAFAVSASTMVPPPLARAILPVATALVQMSAVRNFATRRIAAIKMKASKRTREFTWAHARVQWASGAVKDGWLRAPEAMVFTSAVVAEVTRRLARGEGKPGAFTPGALFGADLAVACGGKFLLNDKFILNDK